MTKLRVLDLFSGLGGFSLGLHRTGGFEKIAFCEIDPSCRQVLAGHWPEIRIFRDVRTLSSTDVGPVDAICGGFPCQDASLGQAPWGRRTGIDGERTGLWREIARLAADLRPDIVLLENVPGLLSAGAGRVLGDLAEIGYDAEWRCIPASRAGLPHRRERLWVVAYPGGSGLAGLVDGRSILQSAEAALPEHGNQAAGAWRSLDARLDGLRGRDGLSLRMEQRRIGALGNSVVPQLPEAIGAAILRRLSLERGTHCARRAAGADGETRGSTAAGA